jgi:hypothetical protein
MACADLRPADDSTHYANIHAIMKLSRPVRSIAAIIMLFSLLFAQLAVAAYACPAQATTVVGMSSMPGCTDMSMDKTSPALCAAHCDAHHQSVDTSGTPAVQPFVPCELELVLPRIERSTPALAFSLESVPLTRATAPPLAIRHCCFRI